MSEKLLEGYQRFKNGYFTEHREELRALAQSQNPPVALITCCDARLEPSLIFDTSPGELFVIRNVANLVPPYELEGSYHGTSAALEFAVTALEVKEIIILGHSRCGGIRALVLDTERMKQDSFIGKWMSIVAPVARLADPDKLNEIQTFNICEQAAVGYSLANLMTYPWIKSRVDAGTLSLKGWHYNIFTGALKQIHDQNNISTIVEAAQD
jgi:carbonic anhydrase